MRSDGDDLLMLLDLEEGGLQMGAEAPLGGLPADPDACLVVLSVDRSGSEASCLDAVSLVIQPCVVVL